MTGRASRCGPPLLALALTAVASGAVCGTAQEPPAGSRLLVLPWLVVDRNTNRDCEKLGPAQAAATEEARRLAQSGQAALDAAMHHHRMMEMIPQTEWEPAWRETKPGAVFRQGEGCAVCTPVGELMRYDRAELQRLAQAVRADYVWLGITVVPLTRVTKDTRTDDCCREALAQERRAVLARTSVLLVRASDGEPVWERDARRLERDVPWRVGKVSRSPAKRRWYAVRDTAHLLGSAFGREHKAALQ